VWFSSRFPELPSCSRFKGRSAPTPGTGSFASFSDPLIDDAGRIAFVAKLSGVPASQATAVFITTPSGPIRALQQGVEIAGTDGLRLRSILGTSWQNSVLLVSATVTGPGVKPTNNKVLLSYTAAGGAKILLRTGDMVEADGATSEIRAIGALTPLPGLTGHCRTQGWARSSRVLHWRTNAACDHSKIDGSSAAVDLHSGHSPGSMSEPSGKALACPPSIRASHAAQCLASRRRAGKVLADRRHAIVEATRRPFVLIAREGALIPSLSGFRYGTLRDPILNVQGRLAWISTVRGEGVTPKTTPASSSFVTGKNTG
jgi:hypothetical protein